MNIDAQPKYFKLVDFGRIIEIILLLFALFLFSGGLLGPLLTEENATEGPLVLRVLFYPVYLLTIVLLVLRPWSTANALGRSFLLLLPVIIALISVNWSIVPDLTLRRAIALLMTTLFAIYLASRYDWQQFIELFAGLFLILALLSIGTVLLLPELGIMSEIHPGAWAGIYSEKNQFGMNMAIAAHLALSAMIFVPKRRLLWGAVLVLTIALVLLSTSKTSLIALVLTLFAALVIYLVRTGPRIAVPLIYFSLVFGVGLMLAVQFFPDFMFSLIGREPTLTGRTEIWASLMEQINNRPWFGYGYAVFWFDETGPVYWVRQQTEWLVPSAHNGWLETWLSIGLVGVVGFALAYLVAFVSALRGLLTGKQAYWTVISMLIFLMFSISESNILQQNNLGWILFAATAAKLFGARPLSFGSKYKGPVKPRLKASKPQQFSQSLGSSVSNIGSGFVAKSPQRNSQKPIDNRLRRTNSHPKPEHS
ncbi:MAG: O-antigen ligase family protein [Robiginitomaculum sp.]|nr:O-antigen ligase family protein [Robiginitomaculum sp.]